MGEFAQRVRRFAEHHQKRWTVVSVFVALSAAVASRLFDRWFDRVVLGSLRDSWEWLATTPIGDAGALLVVLLVVLVLSAFIETSPLIAWWRERSSPRPAVRSVDDRLAVERTHEFWSHDVREALTAAVDVLSETSRHLTAGGNSLATLLYRPIDDLRTTRREFEAVLPHETGTSFAEVLRLLRQLVERYMQCALWYNRCRRLDPTLLLHEAPEQRLRAHRAWVEYHRTFVQELKRLYRHPAFPGEHEASYAVDLSLVKSIDDQRLSPAELALDRWPDPLGQSTPARAE